jgi:proton-translocating NADH-quinone oxidoreductase chain M
VVRNEFLVKSSSYELFHINSFLHKPYKIDIELGVDSISIAFLFLTAFIFYLCTFLAFESFYGDYSSTRLFYILLFSLQFFVSMAFFVMNLILFYFFFEAVLLPMYLIIIIWGSRLRKIKAAYLFFMYTMFLSFFLLYALLIIYNSVSFIFWYEELLEDTTLIFKDFYQQNFLWACFFVALAVKVPIFPLHLWLPEAHVEAPTIGSIILAGVLLKLGGYGILRFLIPVFPESTIYFRPLVLVLCLIGAVYGAFLSFLQVDIKKIVAYSSVSHMNFAVLGLFSLTVEGVVGALLLFLSHGFSSAALFHLVGVFYKRFHTRIIDYYGGLALIMPIQIFFFLFFSFANIGFPGTLNFSSEMIIFFSVVTSGVFNLPVFGLLSVPFMAGVAYSI